MRELSDPFICIICGAQCPESLMTCSEECHEKLEYRLEQEFVEKVENLEKSAMDFRKSLLPAYDDVIMRTNGDPFPCWICATPCSGYHIICADECYEKLVEVLDRDYRIMEQEFGIYNRRPRDIDNMMRERTRMRAQVSQTLRWPRFDGFIAEQSKGDMSVIAKILKENTDIFRVVELGTGHGGMSLFLGSFICDRGGRVLTLDISKLMDGGYPLWCQSAQKYNVSFLQKDVFNPETVKDVSDFIAGHRAMIFCDGGDKKREIPLYAEILKKGDLLLAHDYNAEFTLQDIPEKTLAILEPYRQEEFPKGTRILSMIRN